VVDLGSLVVLEHLVHLVSLADLETLEVQASVEVLGSQEDRDLLVVLA
jgi:hypothetical protein